MPNDTGSTQLDAPPTRPSAAARVAVSYRRRYLQVAAAFVSILLGAAYIAHQQVSSDASESYANTAERQALRERLRALTDEVWFVQSGLQEYMLAPTEAGRASTLALIDRLVETLPMVGNSRLARHYPEVQDDVAALSDELQALRAEAESLMQMRVDAIQLFPATKLLQEIMLPGNVDFYTQATLAIDEADQLSEVPGQAQVRHLFSDVRHSWSQMIGAFRGFIANRFGVFGEPESGMDAQIHNARLYAEAVGNGLRRLRDLDAQGSLEFQQSDSIKRMYAINQRWQKGLDQAEEIYRSAGWRRDVPLLHEEIQPRLARIWQHLRSVDKRLEAFAVDDVNALTATADGLSQSIWMLAAVAVFVTLGGFVLFERTIYRPIDRIARALKSEADGLLDAPLPETDVAEARVLVDAFEHMRRHVRTRQQRLETILDNAAEGIVTFDEEGRLCSVNRAAERLFGYRESELVGAEISRIIPPDTRERRPDYLQHFMRAELQRLIGHEGEVQGRHRDGTRFPMALKVSSMVIDGRQMYTGLVADISERKAMVDHLKAMAEHDGLTGLYNRSYFQQELERVVERSRRTGRASVLLYIDLDNFKYVNDTKGHAAGDQLLVEVSALLQRRARKGDLVARFGGDEFTVLLYDTRIELGETVADSFRSGLSQYCFRHGGEQVDINCSIGVAAIGKGTAGAEEVLSHADYACHMAKRSGRNQVRIFNNKDHAEVTAMSLDMGWSRRIKEAIEHNRFALACQPIVDTRTRKTVAYEVLIRMRDDRGELVMPGGFLPAAERFGLIKDIDRWVTNHAINTLAEQRRVMPDLRYSINLSAQTLSDSGMCELIRERLRATGLDPGALTFEVTETVAIADMSVAENFLAELQQIGCQTALDDFGSGMASFAYLKDLPVDVVKIDGRFIKKLSENPVDQAMVRAMNEIAHTLGKLTVGEFVEDQQSFELLAGYGVDYAQGFHLGRPDVVFPCAAIAETAGVAPACAITPARSGGARSS